MPFACVPILRSAARSKQSRAGIPVLLIPCHTFRPLKRIGTKRIFKSIKYLVSVRFDFILLLLGRNKHIIYRSKLIRNYLKNSKLLFVLIYIGKDVCFPVGSKHHLAVYHIKSGSGIGRIEFRRLLVGKSGNHTHRLFNSKKSHYLFPVQDPDKSNGADHNRKRRGKYLFTNSFLFHNSMPLSLLTRRSTSIRILLRLFQAVRFCSAMSSFWNPSVPRPCFQAKWKH